MKIWEQEQLKKYGLDYIEETFKKQCLREEPQIFSENNIVFEVIGQELKSNIVEITVSGEDPV